MADSNAQVEVIITVNENSRNDLAALSQRLSAKGLKNAVNLTSVGVISGTVAQNKVAKLRDDPDVKAVEVSGEVQLPPPDSEVQ